MTPRFLNVAQIRHIETEAITKHKINLMDLAGGAIAKWVTGNVERTQKILVIIGKGNNGGDGITAAIKLRDLGFDITILPTLLPLNHNTGQLLAKFKQDGGRILARIPTQINSYAVVIDAILGIGIAGKLEAKLVKLITLINQSDKIVLAIDTPSGLNPFSGEVSSVAVRANHTITFISDKPGFYTGHGVDLAGKVSVANLVNINEYKLFKNEALEVLPNELLSMDYKHLIRRQQNTNKGTFGTVVIIGGNKGMHGALYLAGRSAMLMGCGKVILASLDPDFTTDYMLPELITVNYKTVIKNLHEYSAVVVGPGFGSDLKAEKILIKLIEQNPKCKLIFDADALNIVARNKYLQQKFKMINQKVITPHPAEAARLLGMPKIAIEQDRFKAVNELNLRFNAISLLKGAGSLILDVNLVYLNQTGNAALSSSGQGDSLCGMIAAFVAQGLDLTNALRFAVYIHGLAADDLVKTIGYNGLLASEIALNCRLVLNKLLYSK